MADTEDTTPKLPETDIDNEVIEDPSRLFTRPDVGLLTSASFRSDISIPEHVTDQINSDCSWQCKAGECSIEEVLSR